MRSKLFAMTATLGLLGLALLLLGLYAAPPHTAQAANVSARLGEITVCLAGPPDCQYSSIQAAVDAANEGDIIKVAAGTYTDVHVRPRNDVTTTSSVTQVVYLTKTLTIEGGYTTTDWTTPDAEANPTVFDAQGQGRVMYIVENGIQPVVRGLSLTGGDAAGLQGHPHTDEVDVGGGVFIYAANPTVELCQIYSNTADRGGGVWLNSRATLDRNTIADNTAENGGGVMAFFSSDVMLIGNTIISNLATNEGGGLHLFLVYGTLDGNTIMANTAEWSGGGLRIEHESEISLVNNVIADNQLIHSSGRGSGVFLSGFSADLLHNTIARNHGGDGSGIYVVKEPWSPTSITLANTVLVSHDLGIDVTGLSTVTVNGILWHSTPITVSHEPSAVVTVQKQYTGNPAFAADGYHLTAGSAAVDQGVDAGVIVDIDGEPRPAGGGYDLGADELWHEIYLPLVLRNQS